LLKAILAWWASGRGNMQVARNLAVRWDEEAPNVGVDPDVSVLSPPPPAERDLGSVRTWIEGHAPPLLAIEVVSNAHPHKDYVIAPDKYAASGTRELWIFDPHLAGPRSHGGPFRVQIWCRDESGRFVRSYAGEGPAYSELLGAYILAVDEGRKLRIADDEGGTGLWLTGEEHARAAQEKERVAKEDALARVAFLEAELEKRNA
jgi:hypothetical protein